MTIKCNFCACVYKNRVSLRTHLQLHHRSANEHVFECDKCPNTYPSALLLGQHRTKHGATYTCNKCHKGYAHRSSLRQHSCYRVKVRTTCYCSNCGVIFHNLDEFNEHMETCNEVSDDSSLDETPPPKKKRRSDKSTQDASVSFNENCIVCGQIFTDSSTFKKHLTEPCPISANAAKLDEDLEDAPPKKESRSNTVDQAFQDSCIDCQQVFNDSSTFNKHMTESCTMSADVAEDTPPSTKQSSNEEQQTAPGNIIMKQIDTPAGDANKVLVSASSKAYDCSNCGAVFPKRRDLKSHRLACLTENPTEGEVKFRNHELV